MQNRYYPFVGTWNDELTIPDVGTASALITLNLDQMLTETVSVDLLNLATSGHEVLKALDCQHHDVALTKLTFDPKSRLWYGSVPGQCPRGRRQ